MNSNTYVYLALAGSTGCSVLILGLYQLARVAMSAADPRIILSDESRQTGKGLDMAAVPTSSSLDCAFPPLPTADLPDTARDDRVANGRFSRDRLCAHESPNA